MICAVVRPSLRIGVRVVIIPSAYVTDAVTVRIGVRCLILYLYRVVARYVVPVVSLVEIPYRRIGVLVVVIPLTFVAYSVIIRVSMLTFSTGGKRYAYYKREKNKNQFFHYDTSPSLR